MADVFISYAREDRARAEQIAAGLTSMGLTCFWDTEIPPGQTWADYIENKLAQCKAVIVLWSAHSTTSQWVREEARMGRDKGQLIPVTLDSSPAPFGFGDVQAADLSTWRGEPNHLEWRRFTGAVEAAVRGPNAPSREQPQAAAAVSAGTFQFTQAKTSAAGSATSAATPTPISYIQKCLRMYFNANGRARRSEYWWWVLFVVVVSIVVSLLEMLVFGYNAYTSAPNSQVLSGIVGLALAAPGICVTIRRFHDVGLSGWLVAGVFVAYLLGVFTLMIGIGLLIIAVAAIGTLVVALLPSKPGANQYGPNPKENPADAFT